MSHMHARIPHLAIKMAFRLSDIVEDLYPSADESLPIDPHHSSDPEDYDSDHDDVPADFDDMSSNADVD
jgi:hypothetical protein